MHSFLVILFVYSAIAVPFSIWFSWRGAARLDPVAGHGSLGFRMLIVPGAAALWPILAMKVARSREQRS
jgi:hypothetical protein